MWRLAARGFGVRKIGRILRRDHHTVGRHLQRDSGEELALGLALARRTRHAWEIVDRLRDVDLAYQVGLTIENLQALRLEERLKFAQITLDVIKA